jgi:hypothetical protein
MNLCSARAACSMLDCTMDQLQELVDAQLLSALTLGTRVRYFTEEIGILVEAFDGAYCVVAEKV